VSRIDGPMARLARANTRIKELTDSIAESSGKEAYQFRIHPYDHESRQIPEDVHLPEDVSFAPPGAPERRPLVPGAEFVIVREFGIRHSVQNAPDMLPLGAIVGEVVHNLRAALDNMIWELSDAHATAPPEPLPPGGQWRKVQFPVYVNGANWPEAIDKELKFVDPRHRALIKRLQPFNTHRKHPERAPLAVLHELWNRDKHRTLVPVNNLVYLKRIDSDWTFHNPEGSTVKHPPVKATVIHQRGPGNLQDGAELARIRLDEFVVFEALQYAMEMNFEFAYDKAFEKGVPVDGRGGRGIVDVLNRLSDRVTAILWKFDPVLS
jgi:hypothetical protein